MPYPTLAALEKELRALMDSGQFRFEIRPGVDTDGSIHYTPGEGGIVRIDPLQGYLSTTLHELTHYVGDGDFKKWGPLREPFVMVTEEVMLRYINRHKSKLEWWRSRMDEHFDIYDRD